MKDSFFSFKDIFADKWVINARGTYKLKTLFFLREQLGEKLYPHLLESSDGWFCDTRQMLDQIDTDFVFFWIEDHLCLQDPNKFCNLLQDMKNYNIQLCLYSFLHEGYIGKFRELDSRQTESLDFFQVDSDSLDLLQKRHGVFYYIIAVSIFETRLFKNIISSNHPVLKRWDKTLPFDFEKKSSDKVFLPLTMAIPKMELFASIDDDRDEIGYSLINRGFYPLRIDRESFKVSEGLKKTKKSTSSLLQKVRQVFYPLKSLLNRVIYTLS